MFGRGGGIPRGGIMKPPPGAPAAWQPYALVKDAKASAKAAAAAGGKIVNGPMEVPGGDWIFQGIDPQGAMFAVHSLKPAAAAQAGRDREARRGGQAGARRRPRRRSPPRRRPLPRKPRRTKAEGQGGQEGREEGAKKAAKKSAKSARRGAPKKASKKAKKRSKAKNDRRRTSTEAQEGLELSAVP